MVVPGDLCTFPPWAGAWTVGWTLPIDLPARYRLSTVLVVHTEAPCPGGHCHALVPGPWGLGWIREAELRPW